MFLLVNVGNSIASSRVCFQLGDTLGVVHLFLVCLVETFVFFFREGCAFKCSTFIESVCNTFWVVCSSLHRSFTEGLSSVHSI